MGWDFLLMLIANALLPFAEVLRETGLKLSLYVGIICHPAVLVFPGWDIEKAA